jgi:NAD+ diphosphatase
MSKRAIPFTGNPLNRESTRRRDPKWLEQFERDERTRYLPYARLEPLLKHGDERELAWARREMLEEVETPEPIFLGTRDEVAHFAVDVSAVDEPAETLGVADVASFEDLRAMVGVMPLEDASLASQGRAYVDWHARTRFCGSCGGPTRALQGGAHRVCTECQAEHFPRTDPVGIAAVVRGDMCLLGRGPGWPSTMFSALAGFVEPGESLEEAVRREVHEEAGIVVGHVRYVASQPWTFPSSFMIGCLAEAETIEITIDEAELEEARWFSREQLARSYAGDTSEVMVPPPMAIAHHLIRAWLDEGD